MDTVAFLKTSDLITNHLARKAEIALLGHLRGLEGAKEILRAGFPDPDFYIFNCSAARVSDCRETRHQLAT